MSWLIIVVAVASAGMAGIILYRMDRKQRGGMKRKDAESE